MNKITDMVVAAVDEKPDDFKAAFDAALQDKIGEHIAAYKLQIQQGMLEAEDPEQEEEAVEPSEEEIEEALGLAVEEYLEAHPDENEEQALAAIMGELDEDDEDEVEEEEELDELSKQKLTAYAAAAKQSEAGHRSEAASDKKAGFPNFGAKHQAREIKKADQRAAGFKLAAKKIPGAKSKDSYKGNDDRSSY